MKVKWMDINNKRMYFRENYIEEELKDFLLGLGIVEAIEKPKIFEDVCDEEFSKFIEENFGVETEFSWIEWAGGNPTINDWTIQLIDKAIRLSSEDEKQKLYKLIDILIYEKIYRECNENVFHQLFYDKEELCKKIPILCRDGKYRIGSECKLLFMGEKEYGNETEFESIICHEKYSEDEYYTFFEAVKFSNITIPKRFEFKGENYSEKYPLKFWEWVYGCQINDHINTGLVEMLLEGLNNKEFKKSYKDEDKEAAQRFLLKIIEERNISKTGSVELLDSVIADYLKTVNDCSLEISCSDTEKIDIEDIVKEIQSELRFRDKYENNADEINKFMGNIIFVGEKPQKIGYAKLADNTLALPRQADRRKYRECISSFLNEYKISLDKREYIMTAIDNTCYTKVSEITEEEFEALNIENLNWSNIKDNEIKKRFLMEPYLYKNKHIQGYGRTCPLCGKVVITEITTMRIKTILEENKRYDFLCCSSCADLFNYCDNQPRIDFEGLDKINVKIKLKFHIEPHFLNKPYEIEFKPRPLHRKILLTEQRKVEKEGKNNV